MIMKHNAPNRCKPSIEVIMKLRVQWGSIFRGECHGGCERKRRIEVIVKIKENRGRGSGQGGCERRIMQNFFFIGGWEGRVVGSQGGCE